jgi:predicted ATPase/class 3 adenylate cyclase
MPPGLTVLGISARLADGFGKNEEMVLPSGAVTLLFTDIEGSTRLWERHFEAMREALRDHDLLLRELIEQHDGYVFNTVGDAFHGAFASPVNAVAAAVAIQRALHVASWPGAITLRVRMALHSGACVERDGDYFGPVINRVARLEAIAAGGQVVLSGTTATLVESALPPGVELLDLGEHQLKDLGRPELVFQVVAEGLPHSFPPLRSLDNPALRHNLPRQLSTFIGREREVADVAALVRAHPLVALVGPGGAGKSRLSLQVAADAVDGSADGVWLVELAALADKSLVAAAISRALGVPENPERPALDALVDAVGDRRLLLVVDNCEHLLQASAAAIGQLLRSCPGVQVLATSREPLGLPGEVVYRVPCLDVPPYDAVDPVEVMEFEAVRLFVERGAAARGDVQLGPDSAPTIAAICRHLDGLPLAIELAAVRLRSMSVEEVASRLDQRFRLLRGGSEGRPDHQRTLEATIDWSYSMLDDREKLVLDRLSVFAGGCQLRAAEAVCAGNELDDVDVADLLSQLVDKSLVGADLAGAGRYELLESIQQFVAARLAGRGDEEVARTRTVHLAYYAEFTEEADRGLDSAEADRWWVRLEHEQENVRSALEWASQHDPAAQVRLAGAMAQFWNQRGGIVEGQRWVAASLAVAPDVVGPAARARVLWADGFLRRDSQVEMAARLDEARTLAEQCGDLRVKAQASLALAQASLNLGEYDRAVELAEEARALERQLGNAHGEVMALRQLAFNALYLGRFDDLVRYAMEAEEMAHDLGNLRGVVPIICAPVIASVVEGAPARGLGLAARAVDLARETDDPQLGFALEIAAVVHRDSGSLEQAAAMLREALDLGLQPTLHMVRVASALFQTGATLVVAGQYRDGALLMEAQRRFSGEVQIPPGFSAYLERFEQTAATALGEEAEAVRQESDVLPLSRYVALAQERLDALIKAHAVNAAV